MSENKNNKIYNEKVEIIRISRRKISFLLILMIFGFMIFGFTSVMKVDALIPVTYVCCQNYSLYNGTMINGFEDTNNTGVLLDDFGNISNWTVGGTGASQQVDIVNYLFGIQGLKLIATNGNKAYTIKNINNNFSNINNFVVWIYVYDSNNLSNVTMQFTSSPTWNTAFYSKDMTNLNQGWNKLIFNKGDFYSGSNPENWNNIMIKVKLQIWPKSGTNTNTTFDNFRYNMTNDWMVGGPGGYIQPDTTNVVEGQQGEKLIATNGTTVYMDLPINNSFSNLNNFGVWVYLDNASNQNGMTFYVTSNGANWNTYFYDTEWTPGVKTGWNHLIFNRHNFKSVGGENWNNIMNRVRLRIYPNTTILNVTFDNLVNNIAGQRAKLMFQFDDGSESVYQKAFPILNTNNQSGVSFVVINWLAGSGYATATDMNTTQLQNLQSAGWDISSHTLNHADLTAINDSSLTSELNDSYAWLVNNSFQKSAGFIAYPYGKFNDNVINKVQQRYIFGRSTYSEAAQPYTTSADNTNQYIQRIIVTSNVSVPVIEDQINDSINAKLLSILLFHIVNDTNPSNDAYTFLTSDFQKVSNYVKSRSADTDVMTYSDYVIPQINSFTPVINKITRIYSNGSSILMVNNKYDEYMPSMTIIPSSGFVDVNITTYNIGGSVKFNESVSSNSGTILYNIGDRIPNWNYSVNIYWANGTYQNFNIIANNTGYINYNLVGGSRNQDIEPQENVTDTSFTVTLPAGYTSLRFNFSNSTQKNLDPDGQSNSQPFFNIENYGNVIQNFGIYLNDNPVNITTYAALSNDLSRRTPINTSSTIVVPNLAPGNNQNVWIIADSNQGPVQNVNLSLTINSIPQLPNFVSNNCDPSLWNHVWGENSNLTFRLLLNTTYPCISISGTVTYISPQDDGDYHAYLNIDKEYSSTLGIGPEIDFEVVCANANSTKMSVCKNFNQSYLMNNLSVGSHINITGANIIDMYWNSHEIHPVTSIGPATISKTSNKTNYSKVGDIVQYNYGITNLGNSTLSGFNINDNKLGNIPCPGTLSPGQSMGCTSNYTVVQNDINNGNISNYAYISMVSNGTIINSNLASVTIYKQ